MVISTFVLKMPEIMKRKRREKSRSRRKIRESYREMIKKVSVEDGV